MSSSDNQTRILTGPGRSYQKNPRTLGKSDHTITNWISNSCHLWTILPSDKIISFCWLVCRCFEPSQPLRIISGLKTNFNPSLTYSAHRSLDVNHDKRYNHHPTKLFCARGATANDTCFSVARIVYMIYALPFVCYTYS